MRARRPDNLPERRNVAIVVKIPAGQPGPRDIRSAEHNVGSVTGVVLFETFIRSVAAEFEAPHRHQAGAASAQQNCKANGNRTLASKNSNTEQE